MRRSPNTKRALSLAATAAILAALALTIPALASDGEGRFGDDPAGTIASFDAGSGVLTIDLAEGGSIAGLVTRFTWIDDGDRCGDRDGEHGKRPRTWCRHGDEDRDSRHPGHGDSEDLVAGATVDDAVLILKDGRSFFAKVDLDD
jgi:hypothetical protein